MNPRKSPCPHPFNLAMLSSSSVSSSPCCCIKGADMEAQRRLMGGQATGATTAKAARIATTRRRPGTLASPLPPLPSSSSSLPQIWGSYVSSSSSPITLEIRRCRIWSQIVTSHLSQLLVMVTSSEPASHTVVQMPALSPTMNQGNIAKWRKKEGDKIEVGDILCEIETDKATLEFESLEEGYLAKILVPEGSKDIQVGQPIAVIVEEADDIQKVPASFSSISETKEEKIALQGVERQSNTQGTSSVDINTSEHPAHVVVDMPALSPTVFTMPFQSYENCVRVGAIDWDTDFPIPWKNSMLTCQEGVFRMAALSRR